MKQCRSLSRASLRVVILVVGTVLLCLLWWFLGGMVFRHSWEAFRRAKCMNNVKQIGFSMLQWSGDHDGRYPGLVDPETGEEMSAVDETGRYVGKPGDARRAFALLLKHGYVTRPRIFVCPSSGERRSLDDSADYKNTPLVELAAQLTDANVSYGWDPTKSHAADATCAIVADEPPDVVDEPRPGDPVNNSPNHAGDGQSIFYNDGHVKWAETPQTDTGVDDDIYVGGAGY